MGQSQESWQSLKSDTSSTDTISIELVLPGTNGESDQKIMIQEVELCNELLRLMIKSIKPKSADSIKLQE